MNDDEFSAELPEWKGLRETLELIIKEYEIALEADPHTTTDDAADKTQLNLSPIRHRLLKLAENIGKCAAEYDNLLPLLVATEGTSFDPQCGQVITPKALENFDNLNDCVNDLKKRAAEIKSGGGKNNLWKKMHGPPEWRMARNVADYFIAEKMGTREDFHYLCANIQKYITGDDNPSTDTFRDAYRVTNDLKSGKKFRHIRAKYPI